MLPILPLLVLLLFPHAARLPLSGDVRGSEMRAELRLLVALVQSEAQEDPPAVAPRAPRLVAEAPISGDGSYPPRPVRRTARDRDGPIPG